MLPPPINKKTFAFTQSQNPKHHTGDLLSTGVCIMEKCVVPFILLHHSRRTSSRMQNSEIQNTLWKVPMYVLRSFQVLIRSSKLMRTYNTPAHINLKLKKISNRTTQQGKKNLMLYNQQFQQLNENFTRKGRHQSLRPCRHVKFLQDLLKIKILAFLVEAPHFLVS